MTANDTHLLGLTDHLPKNYYCCVCPKKQGREGVETAVVQVRLDGLGPRQRTVINFLLNPCVLPLRVPREITASIDQSFARQEHWSTHVWGSVGRGWSASESSPWFILGHRHTKVEIHQLITANTLACRFSYRQLGAWTHLQAKKWGVNIAPHHTPVFRSLTVNMPFSLQIQYYIVTWRRTVIESEYIYPCPWLAFISEADLKTIRVLNIHKRCHT